MSSVHIGYPGGLEQAKIDYQAKVDTAAGEARLRYLTSIPGQDATYGAKLTDAEKFIADGYHEENIEDYPWLAGEVRTYGKTPTVAALEITTKASQWIQVGVPIEEIRLKAKQAIRDSDSVRVIHSIAKQAIAQLSEI
jgi:hypothetical protein